MPQADWPLSVSMCARILGVHPVTVMRLIRRGELPAYKVGKVWRIEQSEIEKLKRRHTNNGHST